MGEELEQVGGAGEDILEGASSPDASGEGTTPQEEGTGLSGDLKGLIEAEVKKLREQYEGPGGKIALIQSKKDREVAELKKQLKEQQLKQQQQFKAQYEQAQGLMQTDPRKAAQILNTLYQSQQQAAVMESHTQEMAEWMDRVMGDLGLSSDDEETAQFAGEWFEKLAANPDLTWDFQQAAARRKLEAKDQEVKVAQSELKKLQEGLPGLVKQEVTRLLTEAGFSPATTDDGTPAEKEDDWRTQSPGKLIAKGLAERGRK